jgi:protein XagA
MRSARIFVVLASAISVLAACVPPAGKAGAWTQSRGKFYERVAMNRYAAEREFDSGGNRVRFATKGRFTDMNLSDYFEYGASGHLTLITSLSYKYLRDKDSARIAKSWGIGDIDLAARFKIAEGRGRVFSAQGLVKIPEGYDANDYLPLGNGQYDGEARLLFGQSLWPLFPGYCNFEIGHRWRAKNPSDEVRYLAELGTDIRSGFYFRSKLDGIASRRNGRGLDMNGNPTVRDNFDLGKLDMTLGRRLGSRGSIEIGFMPEIYGRTTASGSTISIALSCKKT